MIKDVLVNLSLDRSRDVAGDFAISIASAFDAHVSAIALAFIPVYPSTTLADMVGAGFIDAQRAENRRAATAAIDRFNSAVKAAGVQGDARLAEAGVAEGSRHFGHSARRFDLSVVAQAQPSEYDHELVIERALFESGRPTVIVPYVQRGGLKLDRVIVCWDGSQAAARATGDAMPFLSRAKRVDIVTIAGEPAKSDEIPAADIGHHLARHGFNVDVKRLVAKDVEPAAMILSYAADAAADFVVMGGYGHSRLREFVLGGVTRGMLASMTVPVLMSH